MIKSGQIYKHFKGNLYEVIGTGIHTETDERLVFYRNYNSENEMIYARPTAMFEGVAEKYEGESVKRFTLVGYIDELGDLDEDNDNPIETLE